MPRAPRVAHAVARAIVCACRSVQKLSPCRLSDLPRPPFCKLQASRLQASKLQAPTGLTPFLTNVRMSLSFRKFRRSSPWITPPACPAPTWNGSRSSASLAVKANCEHASSLSVSTYSTSVYSSIQKTRHHGALLRAHRRPSGTRG